MKGATSPEDLFNEFNKLSKEDWVKKMQADLKGQAFDDLVWKSAENIEVQPFYTVEDTQTIEYLAKYQHSFANSDDAAYGPRHWTNYESLNTVDPKKANKTGLSALSAGVEGLLFNIDHANSNPELEILLDQILGEYCHISFRSRENIIPFVKNYINYQVKIGSNPKNIHGFYDRDIIAQWTTGGELDDRYFSQLADLFQLTLPFPGFKPLTISSHHFEHSGAGLVQELAFTLNTAIDYIDRLTDLGLTATEIINGIQFSFSVGSNFFMEIAKLRAFRIVFHQIALTYGLNEFYPGNIKMHITSSYWNKSLLDSDNNMLRNTTEAMAAILGGCDSLLIMPHDNLAQSASSFSVRIARNISNILREEAYLDKVVDPAAGSYYIENLTHEFVTATWTLFQEIEQEGGFIKAFQTNKVQEAIGKAKTEKFSQIASRRSVIVGINQYHDKNQKLNSDARVPEVKGNTENQNHKFLHSHRASEQFEALKIRTLHYTSNQLHGKVPKAFVVALGDSPIQKTRISFIDTTFACAGFEIAKSSPNSSLSEYVDEAIKADEKVVIICGSNEDYEETALGFVKQFKANEPDKMIFLAGKVAKNEEALLQAGLEDFIHLNTDIIALIGKIQAFMGIDQGREVKNEA